MRPEPLPNCREPVSRSLRAAPSAEPISTQRWDIGPSLATGSGRGSGRSAPTVGDGAVAWIILLSFFAFGGTLIAWLMGLFAQRRNSSRRGAVSSEMRLLFASPRGRSHRPADSLCQACLRAGHDVLVVAPRSSWPTLPSQAAVRRRRRSGRRDARADLERVRAAGPGEQDRIVVNEIFAGEFARAALPGMRALVARWRPDVDRARVAASTRRCVAADEFGVPDVHVACFLAVMHGADCGLDESLSRGWALPDAGAALAGGPVDATDAGHAPLPRGAAPGSRCRTGGTAPTRRWSTSPSAPRRPATATSRRSRGAVYALADEPIRVLLTLGTEVDPLDLGPVPDNVHVERWVPQGAVMPHAAAMVGHGGSGSTLMAMAAGLRSRSCRCSRTSRSTPLASRHSAPGSR